MKLNKLMVVLATCVLTACATTPEKCDPSGDPSFIDKLSCISSGAYSERVEQKKNEIKQLREEQKATLERITATSIETDALIKDRANALRKLDNLSDELAALEADLRAKNALSESLKQKIENAKNSVNGAQNTSEDASIIEKKRKIKDLQDTLEELKAAIY